MSHHSPINGKSSPHIAAPDPTRLRQKQSHASSDLESDTHDGAAPSVDVQMAHALQFGHSFSKSVQQRSEQEEAEVNPSSIQRQATNGTDDEDDDGGGPDLSLKQDGDDETVYPKINIGALMRQQEMAQRAQDEEDALRPRVQPKLTVGRPGDRYEQEADRTAAQVMAMPDAITMIW